jgi:hypothetical protein
MNSLYWSHVPASASAQRTYRLNKDSGKTTHQVFNLKGTDASRVTDSLNAYSKHLTEFDNWTRLNTLVSALGYFEIYLGSVISLAIESDPGLLFSISRKIDGVNVLKHGSQSEYSFFDKSEEITKGDWDKRITSYKRIFGTVPSELVDSKALLDRMRKIRNNVSHAFGRDIDLSRARTTTSMVDIERLSLLTLQKYLEIIRRVARAIDAHLLDKHIGEFELIHFYHVKKEELNTKNPVKDLKTKINGLYVEAKSFSYCDDLIKYYQSL